MIYTLDLDPSRTVRAVRLGRQASSEVNRDLGFDPRTSFYGDNVTVEANRNDINRGLACIRTEWEVPLDGRRTRVPHGYWIVRGPSGHLYACDNDTFHQHYSAATDTTTKVPA